MNIFPFSWVTIFSCIQLKFISNKSNYVKKVSMHRDGWLWLYVRVLLDEVKLHKPTKVNYVCCLPLYLVCMDVIYSYIQDEFSGQKKIHTNKIIQWTLRSIMFIVRRLTEWPSYLCKCSCSCFIHKKSLILFCCCWRNHLCVQGRESKRKIKIENALHFKLGGK